MELLLKNWHFMRVFRGGLAVFALSEAWRTGEAMMLMVGGILGLQAIFNVGCCGAAGCAAPPANSKVDASNLEKTEITYEEVRQ